MKYLIYLVALSSLSFACGGSCVECHPRLQPILLEKDHALLNSCVTCHDKPIKDAQCGKDCFDCHDRGRLYSDASVKEHQAIKECYVCHQDSQLLNASKNNLSSPIRQKPLVELFK